MRMGELARWLNERAENCRRIAATKQGMDQVGWLEDARYFEAAIRVVDWASDSPFFPGDVLFDETRPAPKEADQ